MPTRRIVIRAEGGAHARPAAELAHLALTHGGPVTLTAVGGQRVDARSVLAVMDLALVPGDEVVLSAEGPGAEELLEAMERVLGG